ncbi:MAG: hypothetical protein C4554_01135 [Dethiobacter sp.]|jgi:Na+/phosphate symporter|nr:MAG: hypothetical protein C4554_01135 [Dethiobacter sp.]
MKKKIVNSTAVKEINEIMQLFYDFFGEINTAFVKHRLSLKYQQAGSNFAKQSRQRLARFYAATETTGAELLSIQAAAINFSKIFYDILRLSSPVEAKVNEKVLFSDEAVKEMSEILDRTRELLLHVNDALQTGNPLIISHIEKEAEALNSMTLNSTVLHEDRLCKGVCHPKASVIFMLMLQQLQDILWHCKALVSEQNGVPNIAPLHTN